MRICVIEPKKSKSFVKLKLIAENRGHTCKRMNMNDVFFQIENSKFAAYHRKIDLLSFDVYLFRSILENQRSEILALARFLKNKGKIILDSCLANEYLSEYELLEKFSKNAIPIINKIRTNSLKATRDLLIDIPHPILIKPLAPNKKFSLSEDWTDSYDIVQSEKVKYFEIREVLQTREYLKVYTLGGEIKGIIKVYPLEGDLRLNHSRHFSYEVGEKIDDEIKIFCDKVVSSAGYEIASLDIAYKEEELVLLDIQRSPKSKLFNKFFEKAFEELIIIYLEELANSNSN